MRNGVNLPEEIVVDILYRLPAKSVGRCKCVCKPWRTLISNPGFIQTHLSLSNSRPHRSLLLVDEGSLFVVEFPGEQPSGTNDRVSPVRLNFQQTNNWFKAFCSFNGLVLAINLQYELFVLNPTTLEFKQLPKPYGVNFFRHRRVFGFGYDSTTNDYKAMVIFDPNLVYVYRFKSNVWEMLPNSHLDHSKAMSYKESGVALNNSLHWFGEIIPRTPGNKILQSSITAFDLGDEKFRDIPLPSQFDRFDARLLSTLGVVCGCLCIVWQEHSYEMNERVDVWVMKEYGVESSWTKFTFYQEIGIVNPVYFWGKEEFVLIMDEPKVAICNMKEESSTNIVIHGIQGGKSAQAVVHCTFMESLVSPKQLHQETDSFLS